MKKEFGGKLDLAVVFTKYPKEQKSRVHCLLDEYGSDAEEEEKKEIQAKVNQQLQTREDEFKQQLKELVNKANFFYFNIEVILVDGLSDGI